MPRPGRLTAAQRQYLRTHGELPHEATPSERMLYVCCVEYRQAGVYGDPDRNEETRKYREHLRLSIHAFALTILWAKDWSQPVYPDDVKALEREFMRRAKDDPPF